MKKAMLFAITLLFSFSAHAASVNINNDIVGGTATFLNYSFQDSESPSAAYAASKGDFTIGNQVTVTEDTQAVITWTFNPLDSLESAKVSEGAEGIFNPLGLVTLISGAYKFSMYLEAGTTYFFDMVGTMAKQGTIALSVQAVPVPAALWLLAPALMGFFGLRRRSNGLAAA